MPNNKWKTGDQVQLISHSPVMTVESEFQTLEGKQMVQCTWFTKEGERKTEAFLPDTLKAFTR
jgi:uncharacterized protein YodC (DUF2158 family)